MNQKIPTLKNILTKNLDKNCKDNKSDKDRIWKVDKSHLVVTTYSSKAYFVHLVLYKVSNVKVNLMQP